MKELLSREGHGFTERNAEEDPSAYAELIALGFRTVPVTIIGQHRIKGYDPAQLRAALTAVRS